MTNAFRASYIICSTPRSGSTLLCDLLKATGIAGHPQSYFMDQFYEEWAEQFGVSTQDWPAPDAFDLRYLQAVREQASTSHSYERGDVFALRVQQESLHGLCQRLAVLFPGQQSDRDLLHAAFGTGHYIHLSRENKVAQAVSLLRAQQSGLWHIHPDGSERERLSRPRKPVYDFDAIKQLVTRLEDQDRAWSDWFEEQDINPLTVTYETLSGNPGTTIADILNHLRPGVTEFAAVAPATAKLSDEESLVWIARYMREDSDSQDPSP